MDILFLLIPLSVLLSLAVMAVLAWAVWSGQFEELEAESERILLTADASAQRSIDSSADSLELADSIGASLIHINTPTPPLQHTQSSIPQKRVHP